MLLQVSDPGTIMEGRLHFIRQDASCSTLRQREL
jgi:hypothetical protein